MRCVHGSHLFNQCARGHHVFPDPPAAGAQRGRAAADATDRAQGDAGDEAVGGGVRQLADHLRGEGGGGEFCCCWVGGSRGRRCGDWKEAALGWAAFPDARAAGHREARAATSCPAPPRPAMLEATAPRTQEKWPSESSPPVYPQARASQRLCWPGWRAP
jgi:hypothetical protein